VLRRCSTTTTSTAAQLLQHVVQSIGSKVNPRGGIPAGEGLAALYMCVAYSATLEGNRRNGGAAGRGMWLNLGEQVDRKIDPVPYGARSPSELSVLAPDGRTMSTVGRKKRIQWYLSRVRTSRSPCAISEQALQHHHQQSASQTVRPQCPPNVCGTTKSWSIDQTTQGTIWW
jgi:hypothetical protein